jgi:putative ABC transport system permease protein
VPIVPMRIASLKGVSVNVKLAQAAAGAQPSGPGWLYRREFRSTYRKEKSPSEDLVAGAWWPADTGAASPFPVSLERDIARQLGVTVGDEIVWDVQGVLIESRVASLREVHWARFEPNFFAVFPEGPLDAAPQTFVTLGRLQDPADRARLVRALSERFPNISALDLADVQRAIEDILGRVAWAVRFLALFSVVTGGFVLLGAVATSRFERLREATLLKALGATRRQVMAVVLSEYMALGLLSAATGVLLAVGGGYGLTRFVFETGFSLPVASLLAFAAAVVAATMTLGMSGSLAVFRRPALELLRDE